MLDLHLKCGLPNETFPLIINGVQQLEIYSKNEYSNVNCDNRKKKLGAINHESFVTLWRCLSLSGISKRITWKIKFQTKHLLHKMT